jgi:hypothetical protein
VPRTTPSQAEGDDDGEEGEGEGEKDEARTDAWESGWFGP